MSESFLDFLNSKPLYYKEIDHKRVHVAYDRLKPCINRPKKVIHIVGTNGKGSTGRSIAHLAHKSGLDVAHYSSPHIVSFNERMWHNGEYVVDEVLQKAHEDLLKYIGIDMAKELSYFEYTTLLSFVVFQNSDLFIVEAGLGGEFDATNVYGKDLSIVTPIGLDHQAFLGDTITKIATTKINSIESLALISKQESLEVYDIAKEIAEVKKAKLLFMQESEQIVDKVSDFPTYLVDNINTAMKALDILNIKYNIKDLETLKIDGRFEKIASNITIDVGHNILAAQQIVKSMKPNTVLIYNSLDDKDYLTILKTLKPKLKRVEFIELQTSRSATKNSIFNALEQLGIEYKIFNKEINDNEDYLVFGSFYVVEEFLKSMFSKVENVSK